MRQNFSDSGLTYRIILVLSSGVAVVRVGSVHSVDGDIRDRGGGQARQGEGHSATEVSDSDCILYSVFLL